MSNLVKQYREFEKKSAYCFYVGRKQEAKQYDKKADEIRDKFTKADWQELIGITNNIQAKIAWTRMMNERFPETKEELQ